MSIRSVASLLLACATPALAQQSNQAAPPPPPGAGAVDGDDIVVEGLKDLKDGGLPAPGTRAANPLDPRESVPLNRQRFAFADRIAKCAGRGRLSSTEHLRAVLDDAPNKSSQVWAQDRLKRINVTCSESPSLLSWTPPTLGYSVYDRGALTIEAIRRYAPDLDLTAAQTADPQVQRRFNLREEPRARYRLPLDRQFFEVSVCLVRLQPRLSLRLVRTDDFKTIQRIEGTILNNARVCVGGSRNVLFDPTVFRLFIADAVYRWAVAVRGVETLIPDKAS